MTHAIVVPVLWRIEWAFSRPDPTIRSAAIDESAPPASPLRPAGTESVVLPPSEKSFDMTLKTPVRGIAIPFAGARHPSFSGIGESDHMTSQFVGLRYPFPALGTYHSVVLGSLAP